MIEDLRRNEHQFRRIGPVVFLCGGKDSACRRTVTSYMEKYHPEALVFWAEAVWPIIAANHADSNALKMEEALADLADLVAVIVESAGTLAELGAFAISPPLRQKLLPLIDQIHKGEESFVEMGPVRWVDADSHFRPTIWTNLDRILEDADQLDERLSRIVDEDVGPIQNLAASPKHLVFFVCDLVAVFGPCSTSDVADVLQDVISDTDVESVALYLGLAVAMDVLDVFKLDGVDVYFRPMRNGRLRSFHRTKKYIDIPTLRAQVLSSLQGIRAGREALKRLAEHNATS